MGMGIGLGMGLDSGGQPQPHLDGDRWRQVLNRLAESLPATSQRRITIIGGIAMAFAYGSRRTTKDAYVVMASDVAAELLPAADRIAPEFGLPPGWMNQRAVEAEGLIIPPIDGLGRVVFETPTLVLAVPPTEHMLGMKLASFSRGDTDVEDATMLLKALLKHRGLTDAEQVCDFVGGFIPPARRDNALANLHTLWEVIHERA